MTNFNRKKKNQDDSNDDVQRFHRTHSRMILSLFFSTICNLPQRKTAIIIITKCRYNHVEMILRLDLVVAFFFDQRFSVFDFVGFILLKVGHATCLRFIELTLGNL